MALCIRSKTLRIVLFLVCMTVTVIGASAGTPTRYNVTAFNYYPAIFRDTDGKVKGFYVDMLADIAKKEHIEFNYIYGSWNEGLDRMKLKEADLVTSAAYTDERALYLDYCKQPILTVWGELYMKKKAEISSIKDIEGKTIGVVLGDFNASSWRNLIEKFGIHCEYKEYASFLDVFEACQKGEIDAGIASVLFGDAKHLEYGLVPSGFAFAPFDIYFAVPKGTNAELLKMLDHYLEIWKDEPSSVYYTARLKWRTTEPRETIPAWTPYIIAATVCALILAFCLIFYLRRRVSSTRKILAKIEFSLREQNEMTQVLLNSTAQGIHGFDLQGKCIFCNKASLSMLGYSRADEFDGKNLHALFHHTKANGEPYPEAECWIQKNPEKKKHGENEILWRSDGTSFPAEIWSWPIIVDEKINGTVISFIDISDRKNAEQERTARKIAERANEAKCSFLSKMSHELRTPLNSVIVLSGVLNRKLASKIPEEELSYLEIIERNGKNLLDLINDILDLSRIESGNEECNITEFDLSALIRDIIELVEFQAKQKEIEIKNDSIGTQLLITSDRKKCKHIIQNILGNAVKFTDRGSVSVIARRESDSIVVSVSDTGIGIDSLFLPFIFDEFRQADDSDSRKNGGTGLGLAIAKQYAEMLQGHIEVQSERGVGSTFTLHLPALFKGDSTQTVAPSPPLSVSSTRDTVKETATVRLKILIVEDNPDNRITLRAIIANDYETIEAENGYMGLEMAKREKPDLILMDIVMPGMNGMDALMEMKKDFSLMSIPVIAISSSAMKGDGESFVRQGFDAYISKPIDGQLLKKTIGALLP